MSAWTCIAVYADGTVLARRVDRDEERFLGVARAADIVRDPDGDPCLELQGETVWLDEEQTRSLR